MVVKQYVHVSITLVLNNERYQKCDLVREMAVCVKLSHSKHKNELKSLLTLNPQSFKT